MDTMYRGKATAKVGFRDSGEMPQTAATKGTSVKAGEVTAAQIYDLHMHVLESGLQ